MTDLEMFAGARRSDPDHVRRWVTEAMVLVAVADGEFTPREADRIVRVIGESASFIGITPDQLRRTLELVFDGLSRDGLDARLGALSTALPAYEDRVLAFRCVVRVAFADGRFETDELGFLKRMQAALGVVDADVARAFDAAQEADFGAVAEAEPIEAYLDCLLMAAAADRELRDEEMSTIIGFVLTRPELSGLGEDHLNRYLQTQLRAFAAHGWERRLAELSAELEDTVQIENAYGLALAMCFADGDLAPREQAFLADLREALDIDDEQADRVLASVARGG